MTREDSRRQLLKKGAVAGLLAAGTVASAGASDGQSQTPGRPAATGAPEAQAKEVDAGTRRLVTYCGLYCNLCAERVRIPQQARELKDSMHKEGYDFWATEKPGFKEFWTFLTDLVGGGCPGCRAGGGFPGCQIRKCAQEKKVETCPDCAAYPCQLIKDFSKTYPTLIVDGARMKEIGREKWVAEQEERGKTGFAYADVRISRSQE